VRTLVDQIYPAGVYTATWDSRDNAGAVLPSGIYFYELTAGNFKTQRKLLLMK